MKKILDFVKKHPYAVAAGVFGVGILYLLMRGSGTTTTSSGTNDAAALASYDTAATQAATALQSEQLQANAQIAQVNAGVTNATTAANADTSIAQIQANQSVSNTTIAGDVSAYIASLTAGTNNQQIAAQSTVDQAQIAAQVSTTQLNDQALEAVALAPYQLQEAELENNSSAQAVAINSASATLQNAISSYQNGNYSAHGLDDLFGPAIQSAADTLQSAKQAAPA